MPVTTAKLIVKVPSRATSEDIAKVLSDVKELKEKASRTTPSSTTFRRISKVRFKFSPNSATPARLSS